MGRYINNWIVSGWVLGNVALSVPWMTSFGGDWLPGWIWVWADLFPFYFLVTFQEAKIEHIESYLFSMSVIIMFVSPLLLYALNRTYNKLYARIILAGFMLALVAFAIVLFVPSQAKLLDLPFGYFLYACAYALLALGFVKQAATLQS